MELYNGTGVLKTAEIRNAKPIASLLIQTSIAFSELTNETITVFVERANGSNTEIATGINLKEFILLSVYGQSAIYAGNGYKMNALCELSELGAIALGENEAVKFKLDSLKSTATYVVNGMVEPATTTVINRFDRKVALSGESSRDFDVAGYSAVCISNYDKIEELSLTFDNGQVCKYTKAELIAISVDVDPIQVLRTDTANAVDGLVIDSLLSDKLVIPLMGVERLEVIKEQAEVVNLTFKSEK